MLVVRRVAVGPFAANAYLAACDRTRRGAARRSRRRARPRAGAARAGRLHRPADLLHPRPPRPRRRRRRGEGGDRRPAHAPRGGRAVAGLVRSDAWRLLGLEAAARPAIDRAPRGRRGLPGGRAAGARHPHARPLRGLVLPPLPGREGGLHRGHALLRLGRPDRPARRRPRRAHHVDPRAALPARRRRPLLPGPRAGRAHRRRAAARTRSPARPRGAAGSPEPPPRRSPSPSTRRR